MFAWISITTFSFVILECSFRFSLAGVFTDCSAQSTCNANALAAISTATVTTRVIFICDSFRHRREAAAFLTSQNRLTTFLLQTNFVVSRPNEKFCPFPNTPERNRTVLSYADDNPPGG